MSLETIPVETKMITEHPNMRKWFKIYIEKGKWICEYSPTHAHHLIEEATETVKVEGKEDALRRIWRCKWCLKERKTKEVILYSYNDPKS